MNDPLLVGKNTLALISREPPKDYPLERDFKEHTEYTVTDYVNDLHSRSCDNPRLLTIISSLVNRLHAFIRDVDLTRDELEMTIQFLTRAGKESSETMNEFALLGLVLGFNTLIDEISNPKPPGCTESCEAGPFFTENFPVFPSGASISQPGTVGEPMFFSATIRDTLGNSIPNVKAEVWQVDGDGLYDLESAESEMNNRGCIICEPDGSFSYRCVLPTAYSLPSEGPTAELLHALGRHPHRSSHIHFRLTAPGFHTLVTAIYPSHSPFLGTDPVFATRRSLVAEVVQETDATQWAKMGFGDSEIPSGRVWVWRYNFVLPTITEVDDLKRRV